MENEKKVKITKESIIRNIAANSSYTIADVTYFYNALEDFVFDTIHSVDENKDVCIKLFKGINIDGEFIPEKEKKNNLTGKVNLVPAHIKAKCNVTRSYSEKLNDK
ncbi:MAG: HU family DNA-binding protein [Bacilli bacterium]